MSTTKQIVIRDGASKFELFAQLSDIGRGKRVPFRLIVENPSLRGTLNKFEIWVLINGVEAEDGSGECWIIKGYITTDSLREHPWLSESSLFSGFYTTHRREGFLSPIS